MKSNTTEVIPLNSAKNLQLNDDKLSAYVGPTTTVRDDEPTLRKEAQNTPIEGQNKLGRHLANQVNGQFLWDDINNSWYQRDPDFGIWRVQPLRKVRRQLARALEQCKPEFQHGYLTGVMQFVQDELFLEDWTDSRQLLPLQNGVYDLDARKMRDYVIEDRFNWQLPYQYDPEAKSQVIDELIATMANDDPALIEFLYAWLLMVLTGQYEIQKFLELIGAGSTGKSTLLKLATFLVGEENTQVTTLKDLEQNRFEAATLYGKRLAVINDSEKHGGEVATLKALTGGDKIRNERKHQQQAQAFTYTGLVMVAANQPMASSDYTSGLSRRRIPLAFDRVISATEKEAFIKKNKTGVDEVMRANMPALLNKLLAMGVDDAKKTVLANQGTIADNKLAIELETNPLLAWANEHLTRCQKGDETQIGTGAHSPDEALYASYDNYAQHAGRRAISLTAFSRNLIDALQARGIHTHKHRGKGTVLSELRLRFATDPDTLLLDTQVANSTEGAL